MRFHSGRCETKSMSTQRRNVYKFITDLPRMPSSGTTYFETGPRVSNFSILAFMSSTIAFNVFATSATLDSEINTNCVILTLVNMLNFITPQFWNYHYGYVYYLPTTLILTETRFLPSIFTQFSFSHLLSLFVILLQESHQRTHSKCR